MKNISLPLLIMIISVNVCFASFPTACTPSDTLQTEEIKTHHYNLIKMGFDLKSCKCISCRNGFDPIVLEPEYIPIKKESSIIKKESSAQPEKVNGSGISYILLSILSALGTFVFGILSIGNGLSHNGSASAVLFYFFLSVISFVGSIIFGVKARRKGQKLGLAMLGVILGVLAALFLIPLFFV